MKIKTQFSVAVTFFIMILLVVVASVAVTDKQLVFYNQQEDIAGNVERFARELSYISNSYLLYGESQQRARWKSVSTSLAADLARLRPDTPEQQALINNIKANHERLQIIFDEVSAVIEDKARSQSAFLDPTFMRVSWSRMEVQNQGTIFDAFRLYILIDHGIDQLRQRNILLNFILAGIFVVFLLVNYLLVFNRLLKSIAILQAGTKIVGSGNLDYAIEGQRSDEIGELSQAFNQMTADLKRVTASKAELEREVAERKQAEETLRQRSAELEAANKELEAFSYSVSHDLRAPLRHIDGFSRRLLVTYADKLDETGQRYLRNVRESTRKMGQLIDDLLNLSRVTRVEMRYDSVELSEIARLITVELGKDETERRVEFIIGPGITAKGDQQLLRIVLENLLGNAWKFTAKCPAARIEFGSVQQTGGPAFYVRDNGAGFDMAYVGKLFGAFERLHDEGDFPGTGIGLATVQRIIRRHGGRIWAESEVGRGATFYFTLE